MVFPDFVPSNHDERSSQARATRRPFNEPNDAQA